MTTWIIVEDEPDVYEMLLALSDVMGNDGIAFIDGDDAVAWIDDVDNGRFNGELPELALLDIRLPTDTDGAMVGRRLRESPLLGDIAIVLMTAYKLTPEERDAMINHAGADLFLQKPLPAVDELQAMFSRVISQRSLRR